MMDVLGFINWVIDWVVTFILLNFKKLVQVIVIPGLLFIALFVIVAVWFERKYLAHAMLRIGPLYAGRVAGWLQLIADFLKLLTKEVIVPERADTVLFLISPAIMPIFSALSVVLIPFGPDWILFRGGGIGLLLFLAIIGLTPFVIMLAGWASNNRYAIIGSVRAAYLFISAELPLMISSIGVAIMANSFDLIDIVEAQRNVWFIVSQILGFIAFFIAFLAEAERTPFDIPVAEQELVAGWRTEYTGAVFMLTMMAEYAGLCAWALLLVTLYFGGYLSPFPLPILPPMVWLLIKFAIVVVTVILLRTVFPRFRIDQALKIGWYFLIPLSIANLVVTLAYKLLLGGVFP